MFVSNLKAKIWDQNAKYCIKVDISGLQKYPDFGHLLDYDAYFDENCFWWENEYEVQQWLKSNDVTKRKLANFILNNLDDGVLWSDQFDGETSFNVLGTCVIDGNLLTPDRVIEIRSK